MWWVTLLSSVNFWSLLKQLVGAIFVAFILWLCYNIATKFLMPEPPPPKEEIVGSVRAVSACNIFELKSGYFGSTVIKLYGVGVPNANEELGRQAKKVTEQLIRSGDVFCTVYNKEGRYRICVVRNAQNRNVNYELIYSGYAWTQTNEFKDWTNAQKDAQKNKRGVWKTMKLDDGGNLIKQ